MKALRFLPLALLGIVVAALLWRLASPPSETVRSTLIGKPMPVAALPAVIPGKPGFAGTTPGPRLVNIFASWCVPCIAEVKVLELLQREGVRIDGIALRDRPADVADFLARHGDPYASIGADPRSETQIALGSSGVPETFVVDGRGIIRYQHIGPIEAGDVPAILAELERAR